MDILSFKNTFKDFISFDLNDIRKVSAGFDLRRLSEWQKKGYLKMIRKGHYVFSDQQINEPVLYLLANKIYSPSYISMETALSHYNLIPETVYAITSLSSRKTKSFKTDLGEFIYRHIKPQLMFGYILTSYKNHCFKIAEPEKVILDYFYLNTDLSTDDAYAGLRFNEVEFNEQADYNKLQKYLAAFDNKQLEKRFEKFLIYINRDQH